jgi:hypothetical protein
MGRHGWRSMGVFLGTAAALMASAGRAEATTTLSNPFGDNVPVDVVVGSKTVTVPFVGNIVLQVVT